jgi:ABC-type lipoprotein release transport system permease subunit
MLARLELRRRWRGAVVLTLLVGVVGGVVLATLAGARRTDSSLRRFSDSSRAADVTLLPQFGYAPTALQMAALRRVLNVAAVGELRSFAILPTNAPATLTIAAARDGAIGSVVDRDRLVKGRRPRPDSTDEVAISESLAQKTHLGVGGHLDAVSFTPAQLRAALASGAPPPLSMGHPLRWKIVGIVRRPLDLGSLASQGGAAVLTPAFDHANASRIGNFGELIRVRTVHGAADVAGVVAAAQKIFQTSGGPVSAQGIQTEIAGAQDAVDVLTLALRIFAVVVAVAAVITVAIVLSREIALANDERDTLRTLGVTRVQRLLINGPRALLIAMIGALLAVLGAIVASPLLPIGIARKADPDPGLHTDWSVLLPGLVLVIVIVMLIAFVAALFNAHRSATPHLQRRPGLVDHTSTRLRPVPAAGLRMALEPGRGRAAVPVRSACFGAVFGVLGVVAVLVFAASLNQLVTTPKQYGSTWDFITADSGFNPATPHCGTENFGMTAIAGIGALAAICDNDIQLDGRPVTAWGITPVRGTITPTIINGRAPHNAGEVALGAKTLNALHKHIGESVQGLDQQGPVTFRIVGQVIMPTLAYPQPLADGAVFTGSGLMHVYDPNSRASRNFVGRYTPRSDPAAVAHDLAHLKTVGVPARSTVPIEIHRIRNVNWIPTTLAALLALLALVAIGHALVTAVRRRRHDLAILRTLGFNPHQARSTIAWQATILATIGLAGGIPLGVIVGRTAWHLVAESLGIAAITALPIVAILLLIPGAVLLANALAFLPARTAAHINPATDLRTE